MKVEKILDDFAAALARFREALEAGAQDDLTRAGCIQYFEFTFELAWKAIQAVAAFHGLDPVRSPRAAFKEAFAQTWIADQQPWLAMLEARNRMSHIYNANEALAVYNDLSDFAEPLDSLRKNLKSAIQ